MNEMIEQTYKIRRNTDGNMIYADARDLVDTCLDNGLLAGEKDKWVALYRMASEKDPEKYPEGFCKESYDDAVHEVMESDEGIETMLNALAEKDIKFEPKLKREFFDARPMKAKKQQERNEKQEFDME